MKPILFNRADFPAGRTTFLPRPLDRTWHQIEVAGEHPAIFNDGRVTQVIDRTALEMMVDAFYDRDSLDIHFPGLLVDADHLSHDPAQRTEAMGWLKNVEVRDGELWGEIEWTDAGAAAVGHRRYKFFSTEYAAGDLTDLGGGRVRPGRLAGLALTNRPNNRGGRPISNRGPGESPAATSEDDTTTQPNPDNPTMKSIAQKLGLPEDASEQQILDAIAGLQSQVETAQKEKAGHEADQVLNRYGERIPEAARPHWREQLIANRAAAERLIEASFPEAAPQKGATAPQEPRKPLTNRATAATPESKAGDGSPAPAEDARKAAAIRNRASEIQAKEGVQFDAAWNRAKAELA